MNALTTTSINQLQNSKLKGNLKIMLTALEKGKASTWLYAISARNIVKGDQFKDDFTDLKSFAESIAMTKGGLTQMVKAVDFMLNHGLLPKNENGKIDFTAIQLTVSNAYLLSTLKEDEFKAFTEYCKEKKINCYTLSQNELKKILKEFKDSLKEDIEDTEDTEDSKDSKDSKDSEDSKEEMEVIDSKEKALTVIKTLVARFGITSEEIFKG